MKLSFRWFGPDDPVPLAYIAQIPAMRSVVTAVYDAAPGQLTQDQAAALLQSITVYPPQDGTRRIELRWSF